MSQADYLLMLDLRKRVDELERIVAELQETKADRAGRKPAGKQSEEAA